MTVYSDKEHCSGCSACYNICPEKCITMENDSEGFIYPVIDKNKCRNCNLCKKVCPFSDKEIDGDYVEPYVFSCRHKKDSIVNKSTSGGAFTVIAEAFCTEDYAIFGASYDENLKVIHTYINDIKELSVLRKSKYVQSDIGDSYRIVKKFLLEEKKVIFSGTPCQIAGLKKYLRNDYENLLTIEVICHGVPSPLFFEKYKSFLEDKYKSKIKTYDFRNKDYSGWEDSKVVAVFINGKKYSKLSLSKDDPYMNSFLQFNGLRTSCYICPFAKIHRTADFTIGDLWGIDEIKPDINDNTGLSIILCNTDKAKKYIPNIKKISYTEEFKLSQIIQHNGNLQNPTPKNVNRENFMSDMKYLDFNVLRKKYLNGRPIAFKIVSKLLNKKTKLKIKKVLRIIE